ncbi:MAG: hypothetical protein OXF27_08950 [Acidobacteria bacterium]|nr:hypothetical protein [Acidobacteriota bacterium]
MDARVESSAWKGSLVLAVAGIVVTAAAPGCVPAADESASSAAGGDAALRTEFGHPDLRGVWALQTLTPLERPAEFADRATLTEEEVAQIEEEAARNRWREGTLEDHVELREREATGEIPSTSESTAAAASIAIGGFNQVWYERGTEVTRTRQTSLIVDPPDGRLPALTPEGEQMRRDLLEAMEIPDGPENRSLPERCIIGSKQGPPMLPGGYNRNIQIFQTPDHIVIHQEMIHEARFIPLDGRPHPPFRQWRGTSRGYWEGDTLVVETRNFIGQGAVGFMLPIGNPDENMEVVERFTRIDDGAIHYVATATDPTVWTRPWTISYDFERKEGMEGLLFEFACHEGNAGAGGAPPTMINMLISAREREKAGAGAPASQ